MGYLGASKDYDIIINDPTLTEHGFTKFSLPLNGNTVMAVHNTDKSKMMYPKFYISDLQKTVQSLKDKIVSDGILIDDDTADSLVSYFRNAGVLLAEDPDSIFFKNGASGGSHHSRGSGGTTAVAVGNGKSKAKKSQEIQEIISKSQVYKLGDHFLAEAVLNWRT